MFHRDSYINSPIEIEAELRSLFDGNEVCTVFDIGSCEGEDTIRYSRLFPQAKIYSFEPRQDNIATALELIEKYNCKNIILENFALSNQKGSSIFYLSEGEPEHIKNSKDWNFGNKSSSLLAPSDQMRIHTEWLSFDNKIEVRTERLDDYVVSKNIQILDFIHLDVQGAELMVLEGAGSFLKNIKVIWMEVEAVELYKDQPLKEDVELFMRQNNFFKVTDTVNHISGDQLYVNPKYFKSGILKDLQSLNIS